MNTQSVRSVERAIGVLEFVADSSEPATLARISEVIRAPKSTALTILRTLTSRRMLVFDPATKRYAVGPLIRELAGRTNDRMDLLAIARKHLTKLARLTEEAVLLSVLDGHEIVYVDAVDSTQALRYNAHVGSRRPLHCTSAGKLNLALGAPALVDAYLRETGLARHTERTITDEQRLRAEVAQIRGRGYSITVDEYVLGLMAIAAPVFGPGQAVVAAVTLAGPTIRIQKQLRSMTGAVRRTASAITAEYAGVDGSRETSTRAHDRRRDGAGRDRSSQPDAHSRRRT